MALPVLFLFLFPCESHREAYPLARGTHILLNVLLPEEKAMDNDFLKVLAFASALPCLIEDSGPRRGALKGAGSIFSQYIGRQQWVQMWWVSVEKQILKRVAEETKVSARQGITSESKPGKGGKGCWGMRGKIMMLPRQRSTCLVSICILSVFLHATLVFKSTPYAHSYTNITFTVILCQSRHLWERLCCRHPDNKHGAGWFLSYRDAAAAQELCSELLNMFLLL